MFFKHYLIINESKRLKMNKKQLVAKIATACNMGKSDAEKTFDKIQDIILQ